MTKWSRWTTQNENISNKNRTSKPPPIFIQAQLNFNNFCIKIKVLTDSSGFDCKSSTNKLKLQTYSADSYRSVINYLKENNVSFHSYQSKELKAFRAVIRNLHPTTEFSFNKKEFLHSGFTTRNIMPVFHKLTKTPLPIFFIDLEPMLISIKKKTTKVDFKILKHFKSKKTITYTNDLSHQTAKR